MPKILWISPYSLHDLSSGASIHCKTVLEGLVKRGFEVMSCASFIFDVPTGARLFNNLQETLAKSNKKVFELDDQGIHYIYTRCSSTYEHEQTLDDMDLFFNVFCEVLDRFRPDFVMAFGTSMVSMTCFAEAKRRGIYTIYPVLNGNHGNYSFPDIDIILTDSRASEKLYYVRDRIRMIPTSEIFETEKIIAPTHEPKYITFVNPSFEKGLSIFARIAKWAGEKHPELRFLVVNSRGNFAENVQYLHTKGNKDEHPFKPEDFNNIDMTPSTNNMRSVYGVTRMLIAPSLWWESWGRVATEAVLNNIPVLSTTSGGLPEASAGAGICIYPPQHCVDDNLSIPDDEEMQPWFDAFERLLTEDMSDKFKAAAETLSIDKSLDKVVEILKPYIERRERDRAHFNFSQPDL